MAVNHARSKVTNSHFFCAGRTNNKTQRVCPETSLKEIRRTACSSKLHRVSSKQSPSANKRVNMQKVAAQTRLDACEMVCVK